MNPRPALLALAFSVPLACADLSSDRGNGTSDTILVRFDDVTSISGLDVFTHVNGAYGERLFPETMGSGVAFLDYDGDDWPDILAVGGANWPDHGEPVRALWLFRNNGDGTFSDVTEETGLSEIVAYGFGLAVADYDLDGDLDFFLSTLYRDLLFRNDAVPAAEGVIRRFTEVGSAAGVGGGSHWGTSAAFFHADGDPFPDLFVAQYVPWTPETDRFCSVDGTTKSYCTPLAYQGIPPRFFRNNGDGTFSDQTKKAGFDGAEGKSLGVLPLDFDRDGWTDLMVTNDALRDLLYRNNGDGTFSEIGLFAGIAFDERGRARAGMGVDSGVVDSTGNETIFVGNFSNESLGVYRYAPEGVFEERAAASRLARPSTPTLSFGLLLLDVDADGDLDLYTANGHVQDDIELSDTDVSYRQSPHLFLNDGKGVFRDVAGAVGGSFGAPRVARAAAAADFDRDGDMDLVTSENGGPLKLWRNDSPPRHFARFHLQTAGSGADALGASLTLFAPSSVQHRFIRTAHSYLSASEAPVTIGLDSDERIDSVHVIWPGGRTETWRHLEVDRLHRLFEGTSTAPMHADIPTPSAAENNGISP